MAITRRQFVTRLGTLAAAVGMSQADLSRVASAFGALSNSKTLFGTLNKPRVVWIHGAECTGCSTSLLSFLEDPNGKPIYGNKTLTTLQALVAAGIDGASTPTLTGALRAGDTALHIADVVIDVIDLQYHETVMGPAGDLAAQWLKDFLDNGLGDSAVTGGSKLPFVLVVEGALQKKNAQSAWDPTGAYAGHVPWCSIGMSDGYDATKAPNHLDNAGQFEHDMPEVVVKLAKANNCLSVLPVGQCACYGGYPACKPNLASDPEFDTKLSQTGAMGVYDYLDANGGTGKEAAMAKVINSPGCPTNPFWFVLSVIGVMIELQGVLGRGGSIGLFDGIYPAASAVDAGRRLKIGYPVPVHSAYCPRYRYYTKGIYATKPGETGCLQKIGCKGLYTRSLCGVHGWNNMQPQNSGQTFAGAKGGSHCTTAGHPCMGCTEPGYPDRFVPFVKI